MYLSKQDLNAGCRAAIIEHLKINGLLTEGKKKQIAEKITYENVMQYCFNPLQKVISEVYLENNLDTVINDAIKFNSTLHESAELKNGLKLTNITLKEGFDIKEFNTKQGQYLFENLYKRFNVLSEKTNLGADIKRKKVIIGLAESALSYSIFNKLRTAKTECLNKNTCAVLESLAKDCYRKGDILTHKIFVRESLKFASI